ncbi:MAG: SH3 domain-containing protein [Planctomycetes bacterium]|nr:SH3 domain-containing protein [Planctomycetota bacterium]
MQYTVSTRDSNLNVRSGPGPQHSVIGQLARGARVEVVASRPPWQQIASGGWVHGDYLRPASGAATASTDEGVVLDHYRWPRDPNRKMLAGFETGRAELKPAHVAWLSGYVAQRVRMGQWVFLRGYASRLGAGGANQELSVRRANAVREFLINRAGVSGSRITGSGGIGESWSRGSEHDNSAEWRAVEVIVTNGVIQGPEVPITGDSPLSRQFYIKYLGGGGGGPGFVLGVYGFIIRNPDNWYIKYGLGGGGGSIGAPLPSFGNGLPPGQGWVSFRTTALRTVDSFQGHASVRQSGVQIGPVGGNFFFKLWVPGAFEVDLPTGSGFSLTLYQVEMGIFDAASEGPRHGVNWQIY